MKIEVISLGGSSFLTDTIDTKFLNNFKKVITSFTDRKFVIITGGGKFARTYMDALQQPGIPAELISLIGMNVTTLNATFLTSFFTHQHSTLPTNLNEITKLLTTNHIVFCGSLRYELGHTSDGTAAKIARHLKTRFINLTNVNGLYTKDPEKYKDALFLPTVTFDELYKRANRFKFKPGQHFIIDQHAAAIIRNHNIETYIIGKDTNNLSALLKGQKFIGTVVR